MSRDVAQHILVAQPAADSCHDLGQLLNPVDLERAPAGLFGDVTEQGCTALLPGYAFAALAGEGGNTYAVDYRVMLPHGSLQIGDGPGARVVLAIGDDDDRLAFVL